MLNLTLRKTPVCTALSGVCLLVLDNDDQALFINGDVPFYRYIRLSMQHVSMQDALTLSYLSDQFDAQGIETHNWILNTGPTNGFLICLDSCEDALMQLEQRGVTQELCNTIRLLTETLSISMIHFDDTAAALKGIPVYEW